jgi:DNA polymerase-1
VPVPDTQRETLEKVLEKVAPDSEVAEFLRLLLQHKKEAKLYGTYVKGIRKRLIKGRVHTSFRLHGTTTGRLASRNPNMQNIPRDSTIRRQFVAADGRVFVSADFKAAELRVITTEAGDTYLRELLTDDTRDIHGEIATQLFGPGWTKDQRVRAKAVVFGLGYGREAYSLSMEYGWPIRTAEKYMRDFFALIPEVVAWREDIKQRILHGGEDLVSPLNGRRRRFWLITRENQKDVVKEGLAFIPQAVASDLTLESATRLRRDHGVDVRLLVHDNVMAEVREDEAEEVAALMVQVMEQVPKDIYTDYVPFPVDVSIGRSWGDF